LVNNGVDILIDNENLAALFDGNDDYLKISSPEFSKELDGFTVSTWIKPNYDSGSAKLSVISVNNAFDLSINNNFEPKKIATFSIFDGIKWHTIQSKSLVNEEWTHIAATFSDSSISLYINGEKESTLENITTVSIKEGKIIPVSLQTLSPESDMFVGASQNSGDEFPSNYYSGLIDSIEIFDSALGLEQINLLNEKNRESNYQATSSDVHTEKVIETFVGVPNKFGFVADEEQDNSQEIEEAASKGFQVKKKSSKNNPLASNTPASSTPTGFINGTIITGSSYTSTEVQLFDDCTTVTTSSDTSTEFGDGTTVTTSSDTSTAFGDGTTVTTSSDTSTAFGDGTTVTTSSDTSTEVQPFDDCATETTSSDPSTEFDDSTTVTTSSDTSTEFDDSTTVTTSSDTSTEFGDGTTVTTSSDTSTKGKSGPTITTNKKKYLSGETVLISGSKFLSDHTIYLNVTRDGTLAAEWEVLSNQVGSFDTFYVINISGKHFKVTATDGTNTASTTFIDPSVTDWRQCANEKPTLGECIWIGSILQENNSQYFENDQVPQRLMFTGVTATAGSVHTLEFNHQFTKGGIHAYDFLVGYNNGPNNITPLNECGPALGPPSTLAAICNTLRTTGFSIDIAIPNDSFVDSTDGPIQTRINAFEAAHGDRLLRIYGDASFSAGGLSVSHSGMDTADSDSNYVLTWTSASTQILIEFSGHLALSGDPLVDPIAWAPLDGAGRIGGGPYHISLDMLDADSLGSMDNQIKGADVLLTLDGQITIIKNTVPNNAQNFTFTATNLNPTTFELDDFNGQSDDDADGANDRQIFAGLAAGSFTVTEGAVPNGFSFVSLSCVESDTGTLTTTSGTTANIELSDGETVTCTYTNVVNVNVPLALPADAISMTDGATLAVASAVIGNVPLAPPADALPMTDSTTLTVASTPTVNVPLTLPADALPMTDSTTLTVASTPIVNVPLAPPGDPLPMTDSTTLTVASTPTVNVPLTLPADALPMTDSTTLAVTFHSHHLVILYQ